MIYLIFYFLFFIKLKSIIKLLNKVFILKNKFNNRINLNIQIYLILFNFNY